MLLPGQRSASATTMTRLTQPAGKKCSSDPMPLMREDKIPEARADARSIPTTPYSHEVFVEACLQERPPSDMNRIVHEAESLILGEPAPEPHCFTGAIMASCDQKESAVRLL